MGISVNELRSLLYTSRIGADFTRVGTLGRQNIYVTAEDLLYYYRKCGLPLSKSEANSITSEVYGEALLRQLNAKSVDAIDASDYQGANIVFDLNTVMPRELAERFSLVIDFGTLEHVFNFPTASKNLIQLTEIGGHILSVVPANNLCGHGFYQFSPELYFRVFGAENGCEVRAMFLASVVPDDHWKIVTDPAVARRRVTLQNSLPTYMIMLARRNSAALADYTPMQSDYETIKWTTSHTRSAPPRATLKHLIRKKLPRSVQAMLWRLRLLSQAGYKNDYRKFDPEIAPFPH